MMHGIGQDGWCETVREVLNVKKGFQKNGVWEFECDDLKKSQVKR